MKRGEERVAGPGRIDLLAAGGRSVPEQLRRLVRAQPDQQASRVTLRDQQVGSRPEQALEGGERHVPRDVVAADADEIGAPEDRRGPWGQLADVLAGPQVAQEPLPRDRHVRVARG